MDDAPQVKRDPRRALPSVTRLLQALREVCPGLPEWAARAGSRVVLERARALPRGADTDRLVREAAARAAALARPHPRRVVNATGVVLHTNLGRAPLAPAAAEAAARAASAYSDLELDVQSGRRGQRLAAVSRQLVLLSGAEAALVVNNNAAAVLLALATLARGREAIVSRGELVEIGGSFRVPEIMQSAGVQLVEVGTTNRTHRADYERAIGPDTALLLKVHRSNFEQRGFVTDVALPELAGLGRERGLPVLEDLGSGTLVDLRGRGLPAESFAPDRLRRGADLVCFSGDKLLGGPQSGLVLGRAALVDAMRRNPLSRALRLDKSSLAALDWTLRALLEGRGEEEIPTLRQLLAPAAALEPRARRLAERLGRACRGALEVGVEARRAAVGGGSLPGFELDTWVVRLAWPSGADALARALRGAPTPVVSRVRDEAVLVDLRTLLPDDEAAVEAAARHAVARVR